MYYDWVQLWYTIQQRTVLITFNPILRTLTIAQVVYYARQSSPILPLKTQSRNLRTALRQLHN